MVVVDATAGVGRVAGEGAVAQRKRRVVVPDAATEVELAGGQAVGDGQAGNAGADAALDVKHAAGGVAVHRQRTRAGAEDSQVFVDQQLAVCERDGGRRGERKVNSISRRRVGDGLTQCAIGAIISSGSDGESAGTRDW